MTETPSHQQLQGSNDNRTELPHIGRELCAALFHNDLDACLLQLLQHAENMEYQFSEETIAHLFKTMPTGPKS